LCIIAYLDLNLVVARPHTWARTEWLRLAPGSAFGVSTARLLLGQRYVTFRSAASQTIRNAAA
jgi:hypothetical protein